MKEQERKVEKETKAEAGSILQDAWKYAADEICDMLKKVRSQGIDGKSKSIFMFLWFWQSEIHI